MNASPFCPACGGRNDPDATFCESCGSPLGPQPGSAWSQAAPPPAAPPRAPASSWGRRVAIGVVVLAVAGFAYFQFVEPRLAERYLATPRTPEARLMMHVVAGLTDSVRVVLQEGANPDVIPEGWALSPLMAAAQYGKLDALQALLDAGADPNFRMQDGTTALLLAVSSTQESRFDMVTSLLAAGADPNATNAAGESPRSIAVQRGDSDLLAGFDAFDAVDPSGAFTPPAPPLGPGSP